MEKRDQLLTVKEVAAELRQSTRNIRRLVASRELPAILVSTRSLRIERDALDRFLKRKKKM